jgi:hypothetical protein
MLDFNWFILSDEPALPQTLLDRLATRCRDAVASMVRDWRVPVRFRRAAAASSARDWRAGGASLARKWRVAGASPLLLRRVTGAFAENPCIRVNFVNQSA